MVTQQNVEQQDQAKTEQQEQEKFDPQEPETAGQRDSRGAAPRERRPYVSLEERFKAGKERRGRAHRTDHAQWSPAADRPDPISLLQASDPDRIPILVPVRYGRMLESPFAF